jgi:predicted phage tail protein
VKTVYLHGKLGKRFGKKWKLAVDTIPEAMSAIDVNSEGFLEYLCKELFEQKRYVLLKKRPEDTLSEKDVYTEKELHYNGSKEIHIVPIVQGATGLEIVLFGVAFEGIGAVLVMSVISLAISFVMQALFKPPEIDRKDSTTTKSFLLGGVQNRRAQGFPVPVGYGRLKIGSSQISSSNRTIKFSNSKNADTLQSYVQTEILDLLCEGPIEGFVNKYGALVADSNVEEGIFLNNVQVKNTPLNSEEEGTYNYILSEQEIIPELKAGADNETKILSYGINTFIEYKQLLYGAGPYSSGDAKANYDIIDDAIEQGAKIFSHTISNPNVGRITICLSSEVFIQKDDGETVANTVRFAILMKRHNGTFNILDPKSGCELEPMDNGVSDNTEESDDLENAYFELTGIATGTYQFDIIVNFNAKINSEELSQGVVFNIIKLSAELDPSVKVGEVGGVGKSKNLQLTHIVEEIDLPMLYPHTAICKLTFDSKNFSQMPERNYHLKLKKILVPSNYDPVARKYDGPWDGLFKGQDSDDQSVHAVSDEFKVWSDNPAWIFFDMLYNARYGLGKYGIEETNIDKWQLYKIAKYCDELVETDYPIETSTGAPRGFSTDNNMNEADEYFDIILDGNSYYSKSGNTQESGQSSYKAYSSAEFENEFGNGAEYRGRKIAFFIHQGSVSASQLKKKSALRIGEILIEERILHYSDPENKRVTISGPSFSSNPATQSNGSTYGACAVQINHPVVEPRFSANLLMHDRSDALQAMNSMCSIFRGIVAYSAGKILSIQDSFKNPSQLFTNSNIIGGGFRYSGMHKNKKFTASIIRFNNKDKGFRPDVVYEEDAEAMQKLGYQENETLGFGITSSSQARRLAKWMLFSSQLETETITFTAGQEASYLFPGSIFEVSDEMRAGRSNSGRVLGIFDKRKITDTLEIDDPFILIDRLILESPVIDRVEISITAGSTNSSYERIDLRSKFEKSEQDQDAEIVSVSAPQILRFDGMISVNPSLEVEGRSGQKTIVSNLLLKRDFQLSVSKNEFSIYDHKFVDGDRVRFVSDGQLPGGLDPDRISASAYYIINATKSTFQVSKNSNGAPVNITDIGKDRLGNIGGIHFVCPEDKTKTKEAVDQIQAGATYSIKGIIGTKSKLPLTLDQRTNLGLSPAAAESWNFSDIFGLVFNADNNGWLYVQGLHSWVYVKEIADRESGDDIWFYITSIGWVYTNTTLKNEYWYIFKHDEKNDNSSGWVYIYYDDAKKSNISKIFIYDNFTNAAANGSEYVIGEKYVGYIVDSSSSPQGYFFKFNSEIDEPSSLTLGEDNQSFDIGSSDFFYYKTSDISSVFKIDADDSLQQENAIRVELTEGHQIVLKNNITVEIKDVNSNIDGKWKILKVNDNMIELIDSQSQYASSSSTITISNQAKVNYLENPQSAIQRYLQSQLFRTISVKEVSENKYEVTGLEYNQAKFSNVDKKGVIRKPVLPIPPQADMAIPESPENLILTDLTK